jgi:hypothetical protein
MGPDRPEPPPRRSERPPYTVEECDYRRIGVVLPQDCIDWLERTASRDGSSRSDLLEGLVLLAMDDEGIDAYPDRNFHAKRISDVERRHLEDHAAYLRRCARRSLAVALETLLAGDAVTLDETERLIANAAYLDRHGSPQRAEALRAIIIGGPQP